MKSLRGGPLSLSLHSEQSAYADLLYAESERKAGYQGRSAEEVLKDMDRLIEKARG